ncbi:MAG: hypothetical protein ISS75_02370, partial [Pirellulales bacterium]|nr:hypothetical protein [Pirellulales bacterium]
MKIYITKKNVLHQILVTLVVGIGSLCTVGGVFVQAGDREAKIIFQDRFDRTEGNASKENPGNGWGTNSKARAKGEKQVFLRDGAMFIKRAAVADHGVSVT